MSADDRDDLLAEAEEELRRQEEDDQFGEAGEGMRPEPGEYVRGRWRGVGQITTTEYGVRDVYLIWDTDKQPGFLWQDSKLVAQVEEQQPEIGDEVLILRGPTREYESGGERRKIFPYSLRKRPCSAPLPGSQDELPESSEALDDDLPF